MDITGKCSSCQGGSTVLSCSESNLKCYITGKCSRPASQPKDGSVKNETTALVTRQNNIFDKHKSWYKVDIDGDYITKNQPRLAKKEAPPKKEMLLKRKPSIVRSFQPNSSKISEITAPNELSYVHELGMKLAVHVGVLLLFILSTLCGFSYLWPVPVRVAKNKPKVKRVF